MSSPDDGDFPATGSLALGQLAKFDKIEAERFDLRKDAVNSGPIFEQSGEHGFAALQLRRHRGEGGQSGRSEPTLDPDRVQALRCDHGVIVQPDLVSRQRRNVVIAHADPRAISVTLARAGLRGVATGERVARRQNDHAHRAWHRHCGRGC